MARALSARAKRGREVAEFAVGRAEYYGRTPHRAAEKLGRMNHVHTRYLWKDHRERNEPP